MTVICMGGQTGGGARDLGPIVAQRLEADYVDRFILTEVARQVGATVEALHQREERPPTRGERFSRLLQRILERSAVTGAGGDPYFGPGVAAFLSEEYEDLPQVTITKGHELEDEKYIEGIRKVTRDLAAGGNVVLVGRGSHILLRDVPRVLRIGLVASLEDRVANLMRREHLDADQAAKTLRARDAARNDYFRRFFGIGFPDGPELYHITINTSDVSQECAVDLVLRAAKDMEDDKLTRKVGVPA